MLNSLTFSFFLFFFLFFVCLFLVEACRRMNFLPSTALVLGDLVVVLLLICIQFSLRYFHYNFIINPWVICITFLGWFSEFLELTILLIFSVTKDNICCMDDWVVCWNLLCSFFCKYPSCLRKDWLYSPHLLDTGFYGDWLHLLCPSHFCLLVLSIYWEHFVKIS